MFEVSTTNFHTNVDECQLVAERAKFAEHVMVSEGVCFCGKGRLHFIPDKTKVNAKLYVETLLPELVQDCRFVLPSGFIVQPAHMAKLAQDWIATNCSEYIGKGERPSTSSDLNPLDFHVRGARPILERYKSFQPKPENIDELKKVLQLIWDQLPQYSINKDILIFPKRLWAWVTAGDGHFEHTLKWTTCQILVFVIITVNVSWQWKLQVAVDYSVRNWKYGIEYLYSHNFGENNFFLNSEL